MEVTAIPVPSPAVPLIVVATRPVHLFEPPATRYQFADLGPRDLDCLAFVGEA
ncbi:hypothetical protein D3C85_1820310 [compost metagenome]